MIISGDGGLIFMLGSSIAAREGAACSSMSYIRGREDYFILKHSGFFSSTLETLLRYLGVRRLVLTGIAGNFCVLFTANDAYLRDYGLAIPRDCVISNTAKKNEALQLMKRYLKAHIRRSQEIFFRKPNRP